MQLLSFPWYIEAILAVMMRNPSRRVLICGVTGQDGSLLARHYLAKGYAIYGTSRNESQFCNGLVKLGIRDRINVFTLDPSNRADVQGLVEAVDPDLIYNVGGMTSVSDSFADPQEAFSSITIATLNWLDAIRCTNSDIRYFNAGSSECFGNVIRGHPASERTSFSPISPYASAKASAIHIVDIYRKSYGLFCCTGITGNHESPLRGQKFVTHKIISAVNEISEGRRGYLELGNIGVFRDWGWAPEYIEAMSLMMHHDAPGDYIIATGRSISLESFVRIAFDTIGLDYRNYLKTSETLARPNELIYSQLDPSMILTDLGWESRHTVEQTISKMMARIL